MGAEASSESARAFEEVVAAGGVSTAPDKIYAPPRWCAGEGGGIIEGVEDIDWHDTSLLWSSSLAGSLATGS
jgi:hypothetical protein